MALFALSHLGGWHALARQHPGGPKPADGITYSMRSGRAGEFGVSYHGCLNVTVTREGLRVVPLLIFRPFHPPLLLPWACVAGAEERKVSFLRVLEVRCEIGERTLTLYLPPEAAGTVAAARGPGA